MITPRLTDTSALPAQTKNISIETIEELVNKGQNNYAFNLIKFIPDCDLTLFKKKQLFGYLYVF